MNKKSLVISYIVVFSIGILLAVSVCKFKGIDNVSGNEVSKILSDAFFVPAVLLTGIGGQLWTSNLGAFNMVSYGTKYFACKVFNKKEFIKKYKSYYEYMMEKNKEQVKFSFIILPGFIFMIMAFAFTAIYVYN